MICKALLFSIIYLILELIYFRIAHRYKIIDKPNDRSSHNYLTVRGGGIIFPIAALIVLPGIAFPDIFLFSLGLLLIAIVSLADDIHSLNSNLRLIVQIIAVTMAIFPFKANLHWSMMILIFFLFTGVINAYNFMDGINGITALYSIVVLSSLFWVNNNIVQLMPEVFFVSVLSALLVFSFFNVRYKAKCFAGDVGSVSIAFIICFLLVSLFSKTQNFVWLLFLSVYGIDTVFTICCRLIRKEPIFKAHRSHFYQYLVNEAGYNHVTVSSLYAGVQLLFNIFIIFSYKINDLLPVFVSLFVILIIYTIFRFCLEGKHRLFNAYFKVD
ncbi:MAG: glycosyltransferase family 4 protein [Sediminibacterium magnilacihabitans]|nr:glycosyltransferase family 4 protein [Sediminibacterium magnilacihabitans]PQV60056.1 UDP-N-acetylmuramyl pentapeptide phosphotransferase/UDP-N-acetylglucosamine-1-phosphate transferase [Sediminibacterium magnilacihabitans]